jgi:hypothetical protein
MLCGSDFNTSLYEYKRPVRISFDHSVWDGPQPAFVYRLLTNTSIEAVFLPLLSLLGAGVEGLQGLRSRAIFPFLSLFVEIQLRL